jgi:hypothetical protein
MSTDPAGVRVLKAKYADWCSARLADRFLKLTPEEIFELAQQAAPVQTGGAVLSWESESIDSYREMVERVTEALSEHLGLPPFEQWAAAYEANPGQFDHELLGFWKEGVPA